MKIRSSLLAGLALLSAAAPLRAQPQTVTVPLYNLLLSGGVHRLGIMASIGGAPPRMYLFDTGSFGFFSAYAAGAPWWGNFTPTGKTGTVAYGGGSFYYNFATVLADVQLGDNPAATAHGVKLGQILDRENQLANGSYTRDTQFADLVRQGKPPEAGTFYGTLGAGLSYVHQAGDLFTVVLQMPGNLASGYIVHTGGPGGQATLTIGLTPALRRQFKMLVPMRGPNPKAPFPNSGYPTYDETQLHSKLTLRSGARTVSGFLNVILDTGGVDTTLNEAGALTVPADWASNGVVNDGVLFSLSTPTGNGAAPWTWSFLTGATAGVNQVSASPSGNGKLTMNVGPGPFYAYDIMFDLQNGVVGFRPASQTPFARVVVTGNTRVTTPQGRITLEGVAQGSAPISAVQYRVGTGPYRRANGTDLWSVTANLQPGKNIVQIRALTTGGTVSPVLRVIVRRVMP